MRTLNGWPLILLTLFFGVALLPTIVMISLELGRVYWWGPRSNFGLGFIGYLLLEFSLLQPLSDVATNYGYIFKSLRREERLEVLVYILTYLAAVHFVPSAIFFGAIDVLSPWGGSAISWEGLANTTFLFFLFSLMFVVLVWSQFRAGYVQAREDVQNGVPPQLDISSLRKTRDARREQ